MPVPRFSKRAKRAKAAAAASSQRADFWLAAIPIALTLIGLVYLYSATYQAPDPITGAGPWLGLSHLFKLQLVWVALSLAAYYFMSRANFSEPPFHWLAVYLPVIGLLLLTILFGHSAGGAQRWINLGLFKLQPSEYAKIGILLTLSQILSKPGGMNLDRFLGGLGLLAITVALIIAQPDLGTALVFLAIFAALTWLSKGGMRYLLALAVILVLVSVPSWFMLRDYQRERIATFLNPEADLLGSGYNVHQSKIAIGSGGIFGAGLRQGTQTQGNFVPNDETDFIFSVVGEEAGFIGGLVVLALFALLVVRLTWAGQVAGTEYQRLIAYGVSAMLAFQVAVNTGMNMGILPVTGIPLPLFSYGGNSMFTTFLALGICQSIVRNKSRMFQA